MKKQNLLGLLAAGVILSQEGYIADLKDEFTKPIKPSNNSLMKKFMYGKVEILALNQKLANKKAKKLGLIDKY